MKNYADKTSPEINFAVARIVSTDGVVERNDLGNVVLIHDYHNGICLGWKSVDYCNNWADAGPVILENFISIDQHYNGSYARVCGYGDDGLISLQCLRNDILRAAMIVFLMMKDACK
ncbi:MAG: phage protein NinX family protein [Aeromonadaceae bacterium]